MVHPISHLWHGHHIESNGVCLHHWREKSSSQKASGSSEQDCDPPCTDDVEFNFPSTVTVMKADSAIHLDPWCIVDARNAFDRLIREPTGGRGRRTAEELCVF